METFDITKAGLKVGLEIHQQVGRPGDRKLFCDCPADIIERQPDMVFHRVLRASAGETGNVDSAAAAEQAKNKRYQYQAFNDATCLVELDEEPPHPVNQEVITTAVMVAKACGSTVLPKMQFMRKTIVDGSAVSGFQRTGVIAFGGMIPETGDEKRGIPPVRLQTVCVEEDAAKIVARNHDEDIYNISRLGIPLIEIATEPDITTPEQAQQVAASIGMVLRSTKRVKRGLGTIRQDLNVSIVGGTRVEIKGAQDLRMIPTTITNEAMRQHNLLLLRSSLEKTDLSQIREQPLQDVTSIFADSTTGFIKNAISKGDRAIGMRVPGFAGLLGRELCPNYRVGSELADLARSNGFGGLIHSDEDMKKYGLGEQAAHSLREMLSCGGSDAFILLMGGERKASYVLSAIIVPRIIAFKQGVQKEVRKANPDGTTGFLRPMPGAARMYPETDVPLVFVDAKGVEAPLLFTDAVRDIAKRYRLSDDQARDLVREGIPFDEYAARYPSIEPSFLATAISGYGKDILARYKKELDHVPLLDTLFDAVERKKIPKSAVFEILVEIAEGKTTLSTIDYAKYSHIGDADLVRIVREAIAKQPGATTGALMGIVMAAARGKADGKRVMELLETERKNLL